MDSETKLIAVVSAMTVFHAAIDHTGPGILNTRRPRKDAASGSTSGASAFRTPHRGSTIAYPRPAHCPMAL